MQDDAELQPTLAEAEQTLKASLAEACGTDPLRANTGELIKLEEMLSIASDAAKRAVSVRRRLSERRRTSAPPPPSRAERPRTPTEGHDVVAHPALVQRHFRDAAGVEWSVWSVYPTRPASGSGALRGSFSHGWLAFECPTERRRLSPIPDDWDQLDEPGLLGLCAVASPAPPSKRRRSGADSADDAPEAPE